MTGDHPTTPGWHCHRCRSTSCRQRADSDTDHVGRVEYRPLLLTQPSSVSWLWSHTHWCPSQRKKKNLQCPLHSKRSKCPSLSSVVCCALVCSLGTLECWGGRQGGCGLELCVRQLRVCGSQLAVCLVSLFVSVCRSCVSSSSVPRPPIPRWCPVRA